MNNYEGFFLLDNRESKADWDAMESHVHDLLTKYGCEIHNSSKWGERKLAYEIKKHRRGTYLLVYFQADPEKLTELRHDLGLSEKVIRHMFLRLEEFPEIPVEEEAEEGAAEGAKAADGEAKAADGEAKAAPKEGEAAESTDNAAGDAATEAAPAKAEEPAEAPAKAEEPAEASAKVDDTPVGETEKEAPTS